MLVVVAGPTRAGRSMQAAYLVTLLAKARQTRLTWRAFGIFWGGS